MYNKPTRYVQFIIRLCIGYIQYSLSNLWWRFHCKKDTVCKNDENNEQFEVSVVLVKFDVLFNGQFHT